MVAMKLSARSGRVKVPLTFLVSDILMDDMDYLVRFPTLQKLTLQKISWTSWMQTVNQMDGVPSRIALLTIFSLNSQYKHQKLLFETMNNA